ncbi:ribonuclease P protein subunit p40 isoform X2 [Frankliniella occidentalis]|uniref:Ribonuclease P protein subunit p40 isoform X2 n=1 Tax=Frankliniella occidentalis TaxID=133901 RepID=A0A9C6TUQ9_FRAOC|nr:ribonuclease P protein subunit p40 isoform X2 [Frankliniella occidentalis]
MLAPEVWAFDPPASTLKVVQGTVESCKDVQDLIKSHPLNHFVSVVLPDTPQVPQDILEVLSSDNEYYKVIDIPAHELVEKEFIDAFVKRGQITALSIDSLVDLDNCLSLTPDGHLVLSLIKESYQELGLEGKATLSKGKDHQRYIVSLDLTASHFIPGKRNYERAHSALKNCLQPFNLVLSWDPPDGKICPSSVASYLCGRGLTVEVCKPRCVQRRDFNVAVPQLYPDEKECDIQEMMEWLGSFSLNIQRPESEFLSSYQSPEETQDVGQVAYLSWEGLFTTSQVLRLFESVREYFSERNGIPWISMYVQGFADIPISWNTRPHVFYTDGDNSYTVILKPVNTYKLVSHISNNKMIK